jgi:hypothetical protein
VSLGRTTNAGSYRFPTGPRMLSAAFHRLISQPSRRANHVSTGTPSTVPVTVAVCGPPYCWVQITSVFRGGGVSTAGLFFRAPQALAGKG